ncbi:hypothetical protein TrVE_jg8615 [Triparma verrucosa]|uniref:Uncharacterized protein n=1 Tax=Triparma verrucosa TaxID=1606542 RepID=A0A9W7KU43_9STRA|nr:hypothetical protein TrVE_jg8615 [Triparma verrucosa]
MMGQTNPPALVAQVWGIPISQPNPEKVKLIKLVISVACAGAVFRLLLFIFAVVNSGDDVAFWSDTVGLAVSLSIPLCGYMGAKNNSKELICWFTGCNGLIFFVMFIDAVNYYRGSTADEEGRSGADVVPYSVVTIPGIILAALSFKYGAELNSKRDNILVRSAVPPVAFVQQPPLQPQQVVINVGSGGPAAAGYPQQYQQPQPFAPAQMQYQQQQQQQHLQFQQQPQQMQFQQQLQQPVVAHAVEASKNGF